MLKIPIKKSKDEEFSLEEREILKEYLESKSYSYRINDVGRFGRWTVYTMKSEELGTHWVSLTQAGVSVSLSGQRDLVSKIIEHYRNVVDDERMGVSV